MGFNSGFKGLINMMLVLKLLASIFSTLTRSRFFSIVDLFIQNSGYFRVIDFARLQACFYSKGDSCNVCYNIGNLNIFLKTVHEINGREDSPENDALRKLPNFIHNLRTQAHILNFVFPDVGNKSYVRVAGFHACVVLNYATCISLEEENQQLHNNVT